MSKQGFTLSELLIALAILGVIATFTIPKVLSSQQEGKYKPIAKEAAGALSEAYNQYILQNGQSSSMWASELAPYLNYVRIDTAGIVDNTYGIAGGMNCLSSTPCLHLHNGGILRFWNANFGGSNTTNAVLIYLDPDAAYDASATGSGRSVGFLLYYNGRLTTAGERLPGTATSQGAYAGEQDPPWFNWN